jgi:transcriptional regulator with XRE-family HTH domain
VTEERLAAPPESRLRRARRHRNWTLARVVQEIDKRMPGSGVTESLVSAWELGKRKTSLRYREVLCAIYGMPPEALFADQDGRDMSLALVAGSDSTAHAVRLLPSYDELLGTLEEVVRGAHRCLVAAGSRSRDVPYLAEIERVLEERSRLVHYRLLFGPPRWQPLKDHLVRLLELRDPDSWGARDQDAAYRHLRGPLGAGAIFLRQRAACGRDAAVADHRGELRLRRPAARPQRRAGPCAAWQAALPGHAQD